MVVVAVVDKAVVARELFDPAVRRGEEQHNELTAFIFYFLLHKILGLALIAAVCALYTRWAPTDYIISRIHKLCQEE